MSSPSDRGGRARTVGMTTTWSNVTVVRGENVCLSAASGAAKAGRLTALMGPSGSGKTTLLTSIAHRIPLTEGAVRFDGFAWSKALKRRVAFVEQDDVVYAELTVRESLTYLARLRLGLDAAGTKARVDEVIRQLRLDACADTKVGSAMQRGVSGGERKRVCIAQELLVEPAVILLNEPTSGLDSSMAQIAVEVLRDIAQRSGICIICSIHQPSSQIFHSFDDLYLLAKGKCVYAGPVNGAPAHFSSLGLKLPGNYNPSDVYMTWCTDGSLDEPARWDRILALSEERRAAVNIVEGAEANTLVEDTEDRYMLSWAQQARVLLEREWTLRKGNLFDWQQLYLHVGISILAGVMWFQLGYNERYIFPRFTAVFAIQIQWVFFPFLDNLPFVPMSMLHLGKELGVGAYRLSAWYVAKTTAALLPYAYWPFVHSTLIYWMVNANNDGAAYVTMLLILYLTIIQFQSLSIMLSAGVPGPRIMTVALLVMTAMFLFTGIFVPLAETPLPWLGYLNPVLYTLQAMAGVVIGWGPDYQCNDGAVNATQFPDICTGRPDQTVPAERALEQMGVWAAPGEAVGVVIAFTIFFRVMAFRFLKGRMSGKPNPVAAAIGAALAPVKKALTPGGGKAQGGSGKAGAGGGGPEPMQGVTVQRETPASSPAPEARSASGHTSNLHAPGLSRSGRSSAGNSTHTPGGSNAGSRAGKTPPGSPAQAAASPAASRV